MDAEEPVRQCYERQKGNVRAKSWAKELQMELDNVGLIFLWLNEWGCNL